MELTTAQAIAALTLALNTEEVETILSNGEELKVTAYANLFTATEDSIYRIIGLEQTEEEAAFIVIDDLPESPTADKIYRGQTPIYPIRDSLSEALEDYGLLLAEKLECRRSYLEATSL